MNRWYIGAAALLFLAIGAAGMVTFAIRGGHRVFSGNSAFRPQPSMALEEEEARTGGPLGSSLSEQKGWEVLGRGTSVVATGPADASWRMHYASRTDSAARSQHAQARAPHEGEQTVTDTPEREEAARKSCIAKNPECREGIFVTVHGPGDPPGMRTALDS